MTNSNLKMLTEYATRGQCLEEVVKDSRKLQTIPSEYIDAGFAVEAFNQGDKSVVSHLPKEFRNSGFYLELVELCPDIIWTIPRKNLTAKIGKTAVQKMGYEKIADAVKDNPVLLSRLHTSLYDHDTCLNFVESQYFKEHCGKKNSGFNTQEDREKGRLYLNDEFTDTFSLPDMMHWEDVCLLIVGLDGNLIKYASADIITEKICCEAIAHSRFCVDIPDSLKTKDLCLYAFSKNPEYISSIPEAYINEENARKAVEYSGSLLRYVAGGLRTKELCMCAANSGGDKVLEWVPKNILDSEICLTWLKSIKWMLRPLDQIPKNLWNYDICLAAVGLDERELDRVPKEYLDQEMYLAAVRKSASAVENVPKEFFTPEMAELAVRDSAAWFEYIPKQFLTEDICIRAIQRGDRYSRTVLRYVPEEMKTQKMCDVAVSRTAWSLQDVPDKYVTYEILIEVAQTAPGRLADNFPNRFRTKETIQRLIEEAPDAEEYIKKLL